MFPTSYNDITSDCGFENVGLTPTVGILYKVLGGSHLYGLNDHNSDKDYEGIYFPSLSALLGLHSIQKAKHSKEKLGDCTMYSLQGYMELLGDCNFKVLELLYAPEKNIEYKHPIMDELIGIRDELLSSALIEPLVGFARSNLNSCHKVPESIVRKQYYKDGIDWKYMMHTYRILSVGIHYIETGQFRLDWSGSKMLDIKYGRVDFDSLMLEIQAMQDRLYKVVGDRTIQDNNRNRLNNLCVKMSLQLIKELECE
jgi:predicted nucleotidyltransferase